MKTIYKYTLEATEHQVIEMPKNAEILHIDVQHGKPCLWALVDTGLDKEKRAFYTFATGQDINGDLGTINHIGTYQLQGGAYVFHVFVIMNWEDII